MVFHKTIEFPDNGLFQMSRCGRSAPLPYDRPAMIASEAENRPSAACTLVFNHESLSDREFPYSRMVFKSRGILVERIALIVQCARRIEEVRVGASRL